MTATGDKRNGPLLVVKASCYNCQHEEVEDYAVQGDNNVRVFCAHPDVIAQSLLKSRRHVNDAQVGDTVWETPKWCPLLNAALTAHRNGDR